MATKKTPKEAPPPQVAPKPVRVAGPGEPDCPVCRGGGSTEVTYSAEEVRKKPYLMFGAVQTCRCVLERERIEQLDKAWRGLAKVAPSPKSPLSAHLGSDLKVRASAYTLRAHLGRVLRDNPGVLRTARVVSDLDLISAWLATASDDIMDPDVAAHRDREDAYTRLVDLAAYPALLVIRLGVKNARNVALPEVILEAVQCRAHRSKPSWVVEDPDLPREGAPWWSPALQSHLALWDELDLEVSYTPEECLGAMQAYVRPGESPLIRPTAPAPAPVRRPDPAPAGRTAELPNSMQIESKRNQKPKGKSWGARSPREVDE